MHETEPAESLINKTIKPPTFTKRLSEWSIDMLKDFRGTGLRLTTYILMTSIEYATLITSGVEQNTASWIGAGTIVVSMGIGELYIFDRISKNLPWFGVHNRLSRRFSSLRYGDGNPPVN